MSLDKDYDRLCPIFNWNDRGGGVIFPVTVQCEQYGYVNLDGADLSTVLGAITPIQKMRLISMQAVACADDQGTKAATASAEAEIKIIHGTSPLTSAGAGSLVNTITCGATGIPGKVWTPGTSTTPLTVASTEQIGIYLSQTAASATSANEDGGAYIVLWFAAVNAP